jgi:hypothetical protein
MLQLLLAPNDGGTAWRHALAPGEARAGWECLGPQGLARRVGRLLSPSTMGRSNASGATRAPTTDPAFERSGASAGNPSQTSRRKVPRRGATSRRRGRSRRAARAHPRARCGAGRISSALDRRDDLRGAVVPAAAAFQRLAYPGEHGVVAQGDPRENSFVWISNLRRSPPGISLSEAEAGHGGPWANRTAVSPTSAQAAFRRSRAAHSQLVGADPPPPHVRHNIPACPFDLPRLMSGICVRLRVRVPSAARIGLVENSSIQKWFTPRAIRDRRSRLPAAPLHAVTSRSGSE